MKLVISPGDVYGHLTIIKEIEPINNKRRFLCNCVCDNEKVVDLSNLRSGNTKSCGCLQKTTVVKRSTKHGMSKTVIYRRWTHMLSRCYNTNDKRFSSYGGRGISVCKEWHDFNNFYNWSVLNGYDQKLTIERKDVNGNYSPDNCCWATHKEQANNRTNNHFIEYKGMKMTCQQWSERTGIKEGTIRFRLSKGWSVGRALNTPVGVKYG